MKSEQVRKQQVPMESVYPMTIGKQYKFIRNDFYYLFFSHIAYTAFHMILGIVYFQLIQRFRVRGRQNIRPLRKKGFITVANHCHIFDTVLTGMAMLPRRPWFASVQRNFEAPYFRNMFRILRGFPIPDGPVGLRRILKPVVTAVKHGKIVHFFPEEELWHLYQDISFFQRGAFYLAHHAGCPVVPVVHLFRPGKYFGKKRSDNLLTITTVIGEPIYPRIPVQEGKGVDMTSVQEMCDMAQIWMKRMLDDYHHRSG